MILAITFRFNRWLIVRIRPIGDRTSISYNVWDQPVSMTKAFGFTTQTVYDMLGQRIASIARWPGIGNGQERIQDAALRYNGN